MTAPEPRSAGSDGNARGLLVIGVAVVVGLLLLLNVGDGGSDGDGSASSGATTTTLDEGVVDTGGTDTTTTSTTAPDSGRSPSEVKVIVLNGSGQAGAAGATSETLGEAGYTMAEPGNASSATETLVYYAEDYQPDAIAVAELLGKGTDSVRPLSDASLGGAEGDASVVVVLGADTPPVSTETTTTTAADATGN
jgi:hypothetical protein